ncbi:MAG TPA: hypothetical protein VGB98_25810 [Pyrinomonadaceae bacterium]
MLTPITQRWRGGRASYRPAGETINTREYEVALIPDDTTARTFVEEHHYSSTYPAALVRFGLYWHALLVGVAVFSMPCNSATLTNVFPQAAVELLLELGRFVLIDTVPANGETWFKARCREVLKRLGYVGIVSFSDDQPRTDSQGRQIFCGHLGTIYQASGGVFLGRGTPRTLRLLPDGKVFSDRAAQKVRKGEQGWRYATKQLEAFGATPAPEDEQGRRVWLKHWTAELTRPLRHKGNLKYAWALDKSVKLPASLPYPKVKAGDVQASLF